MARPIEVLIYVSVMGLSKVDGKKFQKKSFCYLNVFLAINIQYKVLRYLSVEHIWFNKHCLHYLGIQSPVKEILAYSK